MAYLMRDLCASALVADPRVHWRVALQCRSSYRDR